MDGTSLQHSAFGFSICSDCTLLSNMPETFERWVSTTATVDDWCGSQLHTFTNAQSSDSPQTPPNASSPQTPPNASSMKKSVKSIAGSTQHVKLHGEHSQKMCGKVGCFMIASWMNRHAKPTIATRPCMVNRSH